MIVLNKQKKSKIWCNPHFCGLVCICLSEKVILQISKITFPFTIIQSKVTYLSTYLCLEGLFRLSLTDSQELQNATYVQKCNINNLTKWIKFIFQIKVCLYPWSKDTKICLKSWLWKNMLARFCIVRPFVSPKKMSYARDPWMIGKRYMLCNFA